ELLAECPPHLRGWEWHYLRRLRYGSPLVLRAHSGEATGVAFSPDGRRLATGGSVLNRPVQTGELKVWDLASGRLLWQVPIGGSVSWTVVFSPDGRRITIADWDQATDRPVLKVLDSGTGQERLALKGHDQRIRAVRYSRDGRSLASASDDGTARIW